MGFLSSLFGKSSQPPAPSPLRDTLFGDLPLEAWPPAGSPAKDFPWSAFLAARAQLAAGDDAAAVRSWREIVTHPGLESRHYLQAWHFLREAGHRPAPEVGKQVLGIVVEVPMPNGLDLLAAYPDHTARYYNYSGSAVIWEHADASLDSPIDELLTTAAHIVQKIGPWDRPRPPAPPAEQARLNFLTPSGLHFGQGPLEALAREPLADRFIKLAVALMQALIAKTKRGA